MNQRRNQERNKNIHETENIPSLPTKLWETLKAGLRWKFIALNTHVKKSERAQINESVITLQELGKTKTNQTQTQQMVTKNENPSRN